jgi:DUF1680 family protein
VPGTSNPPAPKVILQPEVLRPASPSQVRLTGYLGHRVSGNRQNRLRDHITLTEERLLEGFRHRPGRQTYTGEHAGKWLDATVLALAHCPTDAHLCDKFHRIARGLMDCQLADGYLGTYLPDERWQHWDVWVHKYAMIGLLAYYEATSDRRALETCCRIADLLAEIFGPDRRDILAEGLHSGLANTSVLLPVCRLYQFTGEPRYRAFAEYVISRADAGPGLLSNLEKCGTVQCVGDRKAYEMMSNYLGLIEYWRATGTRRMLAAARTAWESIRRENRYITGGIEAHETFCSPGQLEPTGACTETCVQVQWLMLNRELLRITGEARFADELHRHVYNHLLAAQRPDGAEWCYFTTLEGEKSYEGTMTCCASNGVRAIALIPTLVYMSGEDRIAVNLYEPGEFRTELGGTAVTICQQTEYPWDGKVRIEVETTRPIHFTLQLLIPFFVEQANLRVAGQSSDTPLRAGSYAELTRCWKDKTTVDLHIAMPVRGYERKERWALLRGPMVLAYDEAANGARSGTEVTPDLNRLAQAEVRPAHRAWGGTPGERAVLMPGNPVAAIAPGHAAIAPLVYRALSEAGTAGGNFSVFLPRSARVGRPSKEGAVWPPRVPGAHFAASRPGRVRGSFIDGDERTTYMTNNGQRNERDWFAVHFAQPLRINRVLFIHGRFLPSGGWWVTRPEGAPPEKPAIEVLRTLDDSWEKVAQIDEYPDTTPTDPGASKPHALYWVDVPEMTVVGVRVSGVPSSGNDPRQNMVSCAEVDVRTVSPATAPQ